MKPRAFPANDGVTCTAERRALAATFRLAVRHDLHESIDNHFSLEVEPGRFLINPYGIHWSRLRAGDLLIVDGDGKVVEGDGEVEATALFIHAAIHRRHPNARCVLHTHMPFATAITCTDGGRLLPVSQTAAIFDGQIAYDDHYGGLGDNPDEGDRLAAAMGAKPVLFMANHGIITTGAGPAEAFNTLYYLERAARLQVLASSTGRPLKLLPPDIVAKTAAGWAGMTDHAERHFKALVDVLDAEEPEYAEL
jgi:ribulose-5-phosphate 4-epimerase/fuculose-1-phosphate aldolase